jgi:hypothetical protein
LGTLGSLNATSFKFSDFYARSLAGAEKKSEENFPEKLKKNIGRKLIGG